MSHTSCLSILFIPVRQADETSGCCDCRSVKTRGEWLSEREWTSLNTSAALSSIWFLHSWQSSILFHPHLISSDSLYSNSLHLTILFWRLQRTVMHLIQSTQLNWFEGHRFYGVRINDGVRLRADKGMEMIEMYTSLLLYNMSHSALYYPIYSIFWILSFLLWRHLLYPIFLTSYFNLNSIMLYKHVPPHPWLYSVYYCSTRLTALFSKQLFHPHPPLLSSSFTLFFSILLCSIS